MLDKLWAFIILFMPLFLCSTPDVSVDILRFKTGSTSFIEASLYIVGSSLTCNPEVSTEYGVEYVIVLKDANQNIVAGNRYRLSSTGCPKTQDLIDSRRFELPAGDYTFEIEMTDFVDTLNTVRIQQQVTVEKPDNTVLLSDIQLLSTIRAEKDGTSALHKSGLYLEPLAFRYYYPALNSIHLYIESYETDKLEGQPYMQYTIKPLTGEIPPPMVTYRKIPKQTVAANVLQLDIRTLISGPYELEAALYDGTKKLITSRKASFSRYNPEGDSIFLATGGLNLDMSFIKNIPDDSLDYHLKAMAPIISSVQMDVLNTILKKGSVKSKQFFIHRYWTDEAGKFAGQAFETYMRVARFVDELFRSGFGYGFETDRGHVFLKYGLPDDVIEVEDEPSAPPYEIWFYNSFPATRQSNVRFLFYNPSLAKNAFKLLHSTAIGEVKNERWEVELYRDATQETPDVNTNVMGDNVYRNARKYFEN